MRMKAGTPEDTGGTDVHLRGTWGALDPAQGGNPERRGVGHLEKAAEVRRTRLGSWGFWVGAMAARVQASSGAG